MSLKIRNSYFGPKVVTDGLVLCLDAANPKSYPGSGTTWTDLSGQGNNGTLVNGVGYSGSNLGTLSFDGSNDYGIIGDTSVLKPTNEITVSAIIYPNLTSYSNCRLFGDWHQTSVFDRWIIYANGSTISWYMRTTTTGEAGTPGWTIASNKWVVLTGRYNGSSQDFFVNGEYFSQRTNVTGLMNTSDGNKPIRFGRQVTTGGAFNGNIAQVSIYNRALTASEIQQNFNATRSRYGL